MSSPADRDLPVQPGDRIRKYEIIEEIGRGGMGVVFRARDTDFGRMVAMKCPWPEMAANRDHRARFLREVKAESNLTHPNIVPLYEAFEENDLPWLVMPHITGQSLRGKIISEGELDTRTVLRFGLELTEALQHAHGKGILHRDINPQNVILSAEERCYLTDFGLAKFVQIASADSGASTETEPMTQRGMILGTPQYMSPEQTRGQEVDVRSDIFSLGLVLYEMATGHQPFDQTDRNALFHAIQNQEPPPIQRYTRNHPPGLETIIYKCITKRVDERYQSASDLAADLRREQRAHRISTTDPSLLPTPPQTGRKWTALAGAVAGILALGIVWYAFVRDTLPAMGTPVQLTGGDSWEGRPVFSPDGNSIAFVSNRTGNRDIFVMGVSGGSLLQLTDSPADDDHPTWLPDGSGLLYASSREGIPSVWRVPEYGGEPMLVLARAHYPAVSPDGNSITFCRPNAVGDLRVYAAPLRNPSEAVQLSHDGDGVFGHHAPSWSRNGKWIAYTSQENLWVVSAGGEDGPRSLMQESGFARFTAWSSDDKRIFFGAAREETEAIWSISRSGGRPARLTLGNSGETDPDVAHDGSRLVYCTENTNHHVWILDRETGAERRLTNLRDETMPSLSADGTRLVFVSDARAGRIEIWTQRLHDGTSVGDPVRLTNEEGICSHPVVSPDGSRVAYYRILGEQRDVFVIPIEGGPAQRITRDSAADFHPAWSPDGRYLAFASDRDDKPSSLWVVEVGDRGPVGAPRLVASGTTGFMAPRWSPDGTRLAAIGLDDTMGDEVWIVPLDGTDPVRIAVETEIGRIHWGPGDDDIWVSAKWTGSLSVRRTSPTGGGFETLDASIDFGATTELGHFDISDNGRFIVFSRQNPRGDIWVLEATPGTY